jgi:hypothetical protein
MAKNINDKIVFESQKLQSGKINQVTVIYGKLKIFNREHY